MEKAPDAFRTISEVADDLNIPQHVLRFWETRFSQIRPMKRSGGRRYYRPDDVDLLKGIRHLLYGEGYTIRGVQRILKEQGLKSVQALAAGATLPAAMRIHAAHAEDDPAEEIVAEDEIDAQAREADEPPVVATAQPVHAEPMFSNAAGASAVRPAHPSPAVITPSRSAGLSEKARAQLQSVLQDLQACRDVLMAAQRA